jgi:P4 family phage/plasmid primase-like protien
MEFAKLMNTYHASASTYTHTRMKGGKFNIPEAEMTDFYKRLTQHLFVEKNELDLLEKRPDGPYKMTLDFDVKYSSKPSKREITTPFMYKLGKLLITFMKDLLEYNDETPENLFDCYILRRPKFYPADEIYKDGLHVQFPNMIFEKKYHEVIVNKLQKSEEISELFSELSCEKKELKDILDIPASVKNFWFIYGCSKAQIPAYQLEMIVCMNEDGDMNINSELTQAYKEKPGKLMKKLSFYFDNENDIDVSFLDKYLEKKKTAVQLPEITTPTASKTSDVNIEKYEKLLSLLKPARWDDYNDWFKIGSALYNTSSDLLNLYKKFSKLSKKYQSGCCEKNWETYSSYDKEQKNGMGSIQHLARLDNLEEFIKWDTLYNDPTKLLMTAIHDRCHEDFARILHKSFSNEYIYCDNNWYKYCPEINRWKKVKDVSNLELKRKLREFNEIIFNEQRKFLKNSISEDPSEEKDDDEEEEEAPKKSKKSGKAKKSFESAEKKLYSSYDATVKTLKNNGFKTAVINECKELFYNDNFAEIIDMNDYLIGFNNGVLDLSTQTFREGHPRDYITFTTGYDFAKEDDKDIQEELMSIVRDIIPNETERNFTLTLFASTLEANNTNELFPCLEGTGGNGKSFVTDLHSYSMGDYAGVTNTFNSPENHNTMLYNNYKKRFLQVNEPSNKKELNLNVIKELTGGDKMQLRAAHSAETITVQPKFKLFCLFNKVPKIEDTNDGGFLRRFVGIKFPNKFVDNPTKPNERKKDENLKMKVKTSLAFHQQWIRILLKYYKKYVEGGRKLAIPDTIKKNSKQLINEQDPVSDFIDSMVSITKNVKSITPLSDIYSEFTGYCQKNYQSKPIQRKELLSRLLEIWDKAIDAEEIKYMDEYKKKKNVFMGIELKKEEIVMSDSE